jgi:hypothetical protein
MWFLAMVRPPAWKSTVLGSDANGRAFHVTVCIRLGFSALLGQSEWGGGSFLAEQDRLGGGMTDDKTPKVRDRAYILWELAGRPDGREHEFWARASFEIEGELERRHKTSDGMMVGGRRSTDPASE